MTRFAKGLGFQIVGVTIVLIGLVCSQIIPRLLLELRDDFLVSAVSYVLSLGLLAIGGTVYTKGRRLRLPLADEVLAKGEPYVLYLRSFDSDTETNRPPADDIHNALAVHLPLLPSSSEEEKLAKALRVIGLGITVGKPGEKLPPLGFGRLYVADSDWMSSVERIIANASLVIIRIGDTPGVLWELERVRQILNPKKLVLLLPRESALIRRLGEDDTGIQLLEYGPYGARWEAELCPGLTVPILKLTSLKVKYSFAGIIYFDSAWVGHARPLGDFVINFTHAIDRAFKPVYKHLGVRKGIRLYEAMAILFGICVVGLIALYSYVGRR